MGAIVARISNLRLLLTPVSEVQKYCLSKIEFRYFLDILRNLLFRPKTTRTMDHQQLEKALNELPATSLISEIPEIQNAIAHLLQSNQEMRQFDPENEDPDFKQAITENLDLILRKEQQIDLTLRIIRERIGEAAWREMSSNVKEFREMHKEQLQKQQKEQQDQEDQEEGVYL